MNIKVLGPGCKNCINLEKNTRAALEELGMQADVEKVTDFGDIASYGIMKTPGLVIDGEVVLSGKVASAKEITVLLRAASA